MGNDFSHDCILPRGKGVNGTAKTGMRCFATPCH
jgi:hypothetical protein